MINVLIAGVGGQGIQLASHMLCVLAMSKSWDAICFDSAGLSEMGASVTSHVRIANNGEKLYTPKIAKGSADLILAFEPMEAARNLPYLAKSGQIITATSTIQPPNSSLTSSNYTSEEVIENLKTSLYTAIMHNMKTSGNKNKNMRYSKMYIVNEDGIAEGRGEAKGLLSTILLTEAIHTECLPFQRNDMAHTIDMCVRPAFRDANLEVMDAVLGLTPKKQKASAV